MKFKDGDSLEIIHERGNGLSLIGIVCQNGTSIHIIMDSDPSYIDARNEIWSIQAILLAGWKITKL